MNLDQMEFRCPDAEVIGNVMVKDYRLAFRGNSRGNGVASILPEQGEQVSGVLWSITENAKKAWITMKDIHICMETGYSCAV